MYLTSIPPNLPGPFSLARSFLLPRLIRHFLCHFATTPPRPDGSLLSMHFQDFCCMPQPKYGSLPKFAEEVVGIGKSEGKLSSPLNKLVEAKKQHAFPEGASRQLSDNRDVEVLLNLAIESIPGYVERCAVMMTVTPPEVNVERNELISYQTWRRRGWCRLEVMCTVLSLDPIRVMNIHNADGQPEFAPMNDPLLLPPGMGDFSCCARNHNDNGRPIICDKFKVASVLNTMLQTKIEDEFLAGGVFTARYLITNTRRILRGVEAEAQAVAALRGDSSWEFWLSKEGRKQSNMVARQMTLSALKLSLRWRDNKIEAGWCNQTGCSLLFWACLGGNLAAIHEILAAAKDGAENASALQEDLERGLVRSWPNLSLFAGTKPLHIAIAFGSTASVKALLGAGADPNVRTARDSNWDPLHMAASFGRADNVRAWLDCFPKWNVEARENLASLTPLMCAALFGTPNTGVMDALIYSGAELRARSAIGEMYLHIFAKNPDVSSGQIARICQHIVSGTGRRSPSRRFQSAKAIQAYFSTHASQATVLTPAVSSKLAMLGHKVRAS